MAVWSTPQCPFAIEYNPQVLEAVRMSVLSAYHALSHGGLEIGGILLGSHSAERITITEFRPIACEHAFGPTFRLSAGDQIQLSAAIARVQAARQTVVGWFHSHTRSGVQLSDADLEIYNRHFVEPWQVALVLKPVAREPTRCGFFFREADGSIHSSESYHEFELETRGAVDLPLKESTPETRSPAVNPPSAPQPMPSTLVEARPAERLPTPLAEYVRNGAPLPPLEPFPPNEPGLNASLAGVAEPWAAPAKVQTGRQPGAWPTHWKGALLLGALVLAIGAVIVFLNSSEPDSRAAHKYLPSSRPTENQQAAAPKVASDTPSEAPLPGRPLGLRLKRQGPDLALTWNRRVAAALGARAGLLTIQDGAKRKEMDLSVEQLRSANILVAPETDHVEVQLAMLLPNGRTVSESGMLFLPAQSSAHQSSAAPKQPVRSHAQGADNEPATNAGEETSQPQPEQSAVGSKTVVPERTQPNSAAPPKLARSLPSETPAPTAPSAPDLAPGAGLASGGIQPPQVLWRKNPVYPSAARGEHLQGVVALEVLVGTDGHVKTLKVVGGHQVFRQAALDAVSQWVYKPAMQNGKAIEVLTRVEILFRHDM